MQIITESASLSEASINDILVHEFHQQEGRRNSCCMCYMSYIDVGVKRLIPRISPHFVLTKS